MWLLYTDLRQPLKPLSKISRLPEFHLPTIRQFVDPAADEGLLELHNRSIASGDRVVTVTVDDRHASAVMGILDMQAPSCLYDGSATSYGVKNLAFGAEGGTRHAQSWMSDKHGRAALGLYSEDRSCPPQRRAAPAGAADMGPISVTSGCKISPLEQGAVRVRGSFFLNNRGAAVINRSASPPATPQRPGKSAINGPDSEL